MKFYFYYYYYYYFSLVDLNIIKFSLMILLLFVLMSMVELIGLLFMDLSYNIMLFFIYEVFLGFDYLIFNFLISGGFIVSVVSLVIFMLNSKFKILYNIFKMIFYNF